MSIYESKTPLDTFQESDSNMWEKSRPLLEKYYTEEISDNIGQHRPTYKYYLSYQLYKTIDKKGGKERLQFVIEHPETLLEEYNKIWNENEIIPKFSTEIVELWKKNMER